MHEPSKGPKRVPERFGVCSSNVLTPSLLCCYESIALHFSDAGWPCCLPSGPRVFAQERSRSPLTHVRLGLLVPASTWLRPSSLARCTVWVGRSGCCHGPVPIPFIHGGIVRRLCGRCFYWDHASTERKRVFSILTLYWASEQSNTTRGCC